MTKKAAETYGAMNKAELVRALTQRDRTIAKLEKQIDRMQAFDNERVDVELRNTRIFTFTTCPDCTTPRVCGSEGVCLKQTTHCTTLPRNPMPWECS